MSASFGLAWPGICSATVFCSSLGGREFLEFCRGGYFASCACVCWELELPTLQLLACNLSPRPGMLPGSAVAASIIVPMLRHQRERPSDLLPRFALFDLRRAGLSPCFRWSGARQVSRRAHTCSTRVAAACWLAQVVLELNRSTQIHPCQMLCRFVG